MDIVEYHAPDRVVRQFGYVQNIPVATVWEHEHYARDERAGVDDAWRLHMQQQVQSWDVRMARLAVVGHDTPIHVYMEWYMRITRIIIGNPSRRRPDGLGYVALAGAYEALVRTVQTMRYESTARTESPETAEYAARMIELAETPETAHDFERLHERVPRAPPGAAGSRGRRGAGGRRRGARAGRGDEAPSTDIPSTSHSRPSTSQTPLYTPDPFPGYVPWPSLSDPPVRDPRGVSGPCS
ncbi:serine/threonine-protein phosphatase 7 long form homolog [Lycium ferocissimum]|uniref:serine/threonine-protein phosphatase 7 long form homolog n=1 Tax=Lycium ferocissimum TaxID=112874 RepID=UPI002815B816|nr:serine/threonine-protein phosphatase 7 long form homolog [Lycium ferocissimum]